MKLQMLTSVVYVILSLALATYSQDSGWSELVALESTREQVEKILGEPEAHFATYGLYKKETGKFHVWYSMGGCHKDVEGIQWDALPQRLTRIVFYPKKSLPIAKYISNQQDFVKTDHPTISSRHFYTSSDETIIYETIATKSASEFVYSVELQPGKDKQKLLCKETK
jgi:hypothetical protein